MQEDDDDGGGGGANGMSSPWRFEEPPGITTRGCCCCCLPRRWEMLDEGALSPPAVVGGGLRCTVRFGLNTRSYSSGSVMSAVAELNSICSSADGLYGNRASGSDGSSYKHDAAQCNQPSNVKQNNRRAGE